jgi:hypothetical protein
MFDGNPFFVCLAAILGMASICTLSARGQARDGIACAMTRPAPEMNVLINDEHHGRFELRFIDGPVRIRKDRLPGLALRPAGVDGRGEFIIDQLGIGGEVFSNVPAIAWDPPAMYGPDDAPDGLLTLDVFRGRLVTLDVANGTLRIADGTLAEAADAVPYVVRTGNDAGGRGMYFEALLAGKPIELALSANAQTTLHFNDAAAADLPLKDEPGLIGRVITEKGESDITGARLAVPLVAGGLVLESAGVRFSDLFDSPALGIGGLDGYAITFDHERLKMRFTRSARQEVAADAVAITRIDDSLTSLRDTFNRDKEKVRLVLILSPT